ncbi:hypothetical protein CWM52_00020 [Raoultella sp. T31]|nr:hypothetical protein CWM52_00020 [Raoultella sp. T31]
MVDIATYSQMSVGQIYRCFESKMEIAKEALKDNFGKQIQLLTLIYTQPDPIDYILSSNMVKNKNSLVQPVFDLKLIFRTESMFYPELSGLQYEYEQKLIKKHLSLIQSGTLFSHDYNVEMIPEIIDFLITETTLMRNRQKFTNKNISVIYKTLINSLKI